MSFSAPGFSVWSFPSTLSHAQVRSVIVARIFPSASPLRLQFQAPSATFTPVIASSSGLTGSGPKWAAIGARARSTCAVCRRLSSLRCRPRGNDAGVRHSWRPDRTHVTDAVQTRPLCSPSTEHKLCCHCTKLPWGLGELRRGRAASASLLVPPHLCKHSAADRRVVLARSSWTDCIWKCYGHSQSHSSDCSGHREVKAHWTGMPTICRSSATTRTPSRKDVWQTST